MTEGQALPGSRRDLKYVVLADTLRGDIATGAWALGGRLPTERELALHHAVAVNTVRRAVSILCSEGLLERRQGAGTFVLSRPSEQAAKPKLVGVLIPSTTYYYPRVLAGIERALSAQDVRMMLTCASYDPAEELRQASRLVSAGAQGLLLVPTFHVLERPAAHLMALGSIGVPYVLVERTPPVMPLDDDTEYVATDHVAGAYSAVRHLSRLGHERIAYLGRSGTASAGPVSEGFDAALANHVASRDQLVRRDVGVLPDVSPGVRPDVSVSAW
jgi:GntR family transcriptional regulator of arabinose operon